MNTCKIYFLFILLLINGCSLEENPIGKVTPQQFFQNTEEIEQFMRGAYAPLGKYDFYGMCWWNRAEAINDQITCRVDLRNNFNYDTPGDGYPLLWKWIYSGVNSANMLIGALTECSFLDEESRSHYIAEARFLRALYYFHAILAYGKVPLILENTSFQDAMIMGRTDVELVWEQVFSDMIYASENCVDTFGEVKSRGTKWTAMSLLSRMYLYNKKYKEAAYYAKKVIDSGPYVLEKNFADIWLEENERGKEVIFSIEFMKSVYTSSYASFFTPRGDKEPSTTPGVTWNGWGSNAVGSLLPGMFEDGDIRKEQTVVNKNWLDGNKPFVTNEWNFGPKFWDFNNPRAASAKDFLLMRYAEVLLNYAEAENEVNGPQNAYNALNEVRERAGLKPLYGLTKDQFRVAVRQERAVELVGEGHRRWDLIRWGIWLSTMKSLPDVDFPKAGKENISSRDELFPIPPIEIAKNKNLLPNNPGY